MKKSSPVNSTFEDPTPSARSIQVEPISNALNFESETLNQTEYYFSLYRLPKEETAATLKNPTAFDPVGLALVMLVETLESGLENNSENPPGL